MALMSAAVGTVTSRAAIAEGEPTAAQGTAIVTHRPLGAGRTESLDPVVTYIVRFADGLDAASGASALRDAGVDVYDTFDEVFAGAIVGARPDLAAALGADPRIAAIEPDRVVTTSDGGPASHVEALQPAAPWGLDRLDDGPGRTAPTSTAPPGPASRSTSSIPVCSPSTSTSAAASVNGAWLEPTLHRARRLQRPRHARRRDPRLEHVRRRQGRDDLPAADLRLQRLGHRVGRDPRTELHRRTSPAGPARRPQPERRRCSEQRRGRRGAGGDRRRRHGRGRRRQRRHAGVHAHAGPGARGDHRRGHGRP